MAFDRAPIATIVPSAEALILVPLSSPATLPTISAPSWFHVAPYVVATFDVGVGITDDPSAILLVIVFVFPKFTINDPETDAEEKIPLAAWVAVMVVVPIPAIVTVPPDVTVATLVSLLEYVNAPPLLLLDGGVILKDASPNIFVGMVSAPNTVTVPVTTKSALLVIDLS